MGKVRVDGGPGRPRPDGEVRHRASGSQRAENQGRGARPQADEGRPGKTLVVSHSDDETEASGGVERALRARRSVAQHLAASVDQRRLSQGIIIIINNNNTLYFNNNHTLSVSLINF